MREHFRRLQKHYQYFHQKDYQNLRRVTRILTWMVDQMPENYFQEQKAGQKLVQRVSLLHRNWNLRQTQEQSQTQEQQC
jgi:tRNA-dihydrouridine synthase